ncbi:rod shape-determining protein MreD [Thioalkalivibrio sulfidiphilus]|uniref:Rod shape-determining protein MreD n=1 Tax=Thioalkalivibrio sulfidiphilus (strain HL-EbGR7) TaxID=396588 RepID=B8GL91_THISH|nr:rod shape-determining protein MreD [Thioalkalivibrio sulfidiphilus]ACL71609.1 rod shape-determining protein MreD [Thioalkalivibrio sulfidiphilus HL-EbGr7]
MSNPRGWVWAIPLTFIVALALTVVPLPDWAAPWRPQWLAMTLIYWSMALPRRIGVGLGWFLGLLLDAATGALLGQHALGFALIAYLSIRMHQRVRVFPLWQQALTVGGLLALHLLLVLWILGMTGRAPGTWLYWAPLVSSMILWPWLFVLLRDVRRRWCLALS